jgi:hypothetical protein
VTIDVYCTSTDHADWLEVGNPERFSLSASTLVVLAGAFLVKSSTVWLRRWRPPADVSGPAGAWHIP